MANPVANRASRRNQPLWLGHLYYAALCLLPALAAALGTKAWRAARLIDRLHLPLHLSYLALFLPDLGLWLAGAGALGALLHLGHRRLPRATMLLAHVLAAIAAAVPALDLVFFATTGDQLDWDLFAYAVRHFAMLQQVLGSETTPAKLAMLIGLLTVTTLPWPLRARLLQVGPWQRRDTVAVLLVTVALLAPLGPRALTHPVGLPPALQPLDHALQWTWAVAATASPAPFDEKTQLAPQWAWERIRQDPKQRYNVLVVLLESTRATATSLEHPELPTTPRLAALAKQGLSAPHAYTTIPHTTKALVATLCGYPPRIDPEFSETEWGALPASCMAEVLGELGYSSLFLTAASGRFENNHQLVEQMGYQTVITGDELAQPAYAARLAGKSQINYFGYEDAVLPSLLLEWTAQQRGPFFATVLTLNAHHPYQLPGDRPRLDLAPGALGDYLTAVQSTDTALGEILDGLQKQGHGRDTVVIVLGDHGEAFGEHGQAQHDDVPYDEALHIPLVVAGPGVTPGTTATGLRQNLDVAPTILNLLSITTEGMRPGRSLLMPRGHSQLHLAVWPRNRALVQLSGGIKLIDHLGRRTPEAYFLAADPSETLDIAPYLPAQQLQRAQADLAKWRTYVTAAWDQQQQARRTQVLDQVPNTAARLPQDLGCGLRLLAIQTARTGQDIELTVYLRAVAPGTVVRRLELREQPTPRSRVVFPPAPVPRPLPPPAWPLGAVVVQHYRLYTPELELQLLARQGNGEACAAPVAIPLPPLLH